MLDEFQANERSHIDVCKFSTHEHMCTHSHMHVCTDMTKSISIIIGIMLVYFSSSKKGLFSC